MARTVPRFILGLVVLLAVILAAALLTLNGPAPAPPPLPNPNGYADLVQAGRMLTNAVEDYDVLSQVELRAAVTTNAEALKLVRPGLSRPCRVPLDYSPTSPNVQELAVFKRLARALCAEGRLAELENRPNDALTAYLDTVRLGYELPRGGAIIHALVGIATEAMGIGRLEKIFPKLDAKQSREVATTLEALESKQQSIETMLEQEHTWARRSFGLRGQVARLLQFRSLKQMEKNLVAKIQAQQLRNRRLMVGLAAHAYELEKGERPKTLADLVPAYLKAIPQDPLTGTNLVYRP